MISNEQAQVFHKQ